jgi:hypothetical protein
MQNIGRGPADAGRSGGDQNALAVELQIHRDLP